MKSLGVALAVAVVAAPLPSYAGDGRVVAGALGGLAAGAIIGSALAPRYAPPPPPGYYAPGPVYVAPPYRYAPAPVYGPAYAEPPTCYWTRGEPAWDGYRWFRPRVQVCE
jgi:hypothetical protein